MSRLCCRGDGLCRDSFRSLLSFLNILSRWTEPHFRGECTERKALHGAQAALPSIRQSRISEPYNVSQTWGKARRGKMWERKGEQRGAGQIFEAFVGEKRPLLVLFLSSAERRPVAGSYCAHCEAAEQRGMFGWLSGKHHFRAHSCHSPGTWILPQRVQWWRAGRDRYVLHFKMESWDRRACESRAAASTSSSSGVTQLDTFGCRCKAFEW